LTTVGLRREDTGKGSTLCILGALQSDVEVVKTLSRLHL